MCAAFLFPHPYMKLTHTHPIIAIATAPGRGGIGVVRISGCRLDDLIQALCKRPLTPRHATYMDFLNVDGSPIDAGLALYFPAPHSYTGEDVLELQGHGGPVVLQMLIERCLQVGTDIGLKLAEPGEFTRRAFLNDKLDLAQAEAVADLIEASTTAAAKSAQASLSGAFSQAVHALVEAVIHLRMLVEATLDFPEEEIDFLEKADARGQLARIRVQLQHLLDQSQQGALLRNGLKVVLAGRPNVGKSSLLNALAQAEVAIVTAIAGTTRDKIVETIQIEGIPLHIIDTAGLRDDAEADEVERIGIARTWAEIERADVILNLRDATQPDTVEDEVIAARLQAISAVPRRIVYNKVDLTKDVARLDAEQIYLSAKTGAGIDLLRKELLAIAGWHSSSETVYLARERHLIALRSAALHLADAADHAAQNDRVLDLFAEELRLAQDQLNTITGAFSADDLLGEIFSRFCIGK